MKKARIGIIGCGQIVKIRHAPELAACEWAETAGYYDFVPERAQAFAEQYGGKAYADYQEMLQDPEIDGVVICTANNAHAPMSVEALRAGKSVLCEKPMASDFEGAKTILEADRESSGFFMAAHNQRFTMAHRKAKELLENGTMGRVLSFRCTLAHPGPERFSVNRTNSCWYLKKSASGLGCISDLGIHKCDILMHLLGEPITSVAAIAGTRDKHDETGKLAEVYDNAVCVMETASGVMGTLNLSYTNYSGMENTTVYYCEKGVLRCHYYPDCSLEVVMDGAETVRYFDLPQPNSGVVNAFAKAIVENKPSPVPATEALLAMRVVFAIEEAARTKKMAAIKNV